MRIPIYYLCDVGSYTNCRKTNCSRQKIGFCKHTIFNEYSRNWKERPPTNGELLLFFKYQAGAWYETENKEAEPLSKTLPEKIENFILYGKETNNE